VESCIYEGRVRHSRTSPVEHRFAYRIFYMYLDLAELPTLFDRRWFWSVRRRALARFRRSDHVGDESEPLVSTIRRLVAGETGREPRGPIRLLTHLSYFGYCFNPVSFYYCFDEDGRDVETIVAEVSNTPWGERTCYVLPVEQSLTKGRALRFTPEKKMHVSPFMDMDISYDWSFTQPGEGLKVFMANARDGQRFFDASISLERREINGRSLASVLFRYPWMTGRVVAGIYWQALLLWIKRCPFYPHPSKRQPITAK
jgi:DUF1365 family protein